MRSIWRQDLYIVKYIENIITTEFKSTSLKQACRSFSCLVIITNLNHKYGLQLLLTDIRIILFNLGN